MTILADRPVTGLTTPFSNVGSFDWPSVLSLTSPEPKAAASRPHRVRIAVAGAVETQQPLPYLQDIERKINRLLELPAGWDGRRATRTTVPAVGATVRLLLALMTPQSLPVQLFPLPDGGIQVEWHVAGSSIEIDIDGKGEAFVTAETSEGRLIAEGDLDVNSLGGLMKDTRRFLSRMSRSAVVR